MPKNFINFILVNAWIGSDHTRTPVGSTEYVRVTNLKQRIRIFPHNVDLAVCGDDGKLVLHTSGGTVVVVPEDQSKRVLNQINRALDRRKP